MVRLSETFSMGDLTIAALSDGAAPRQIGGFFHGIEPDEWMRALGLTSAEERVPFNFGAFLVRGDGHTTLIDSGYGVSARTMDLEGGGELTKRIEELGIGLDEIDRVVHTHLHVDHVGWDIDDDRDGALTFPNATVYVHERELAYWTSPEADGNRLAPRARQVASALGAAGQIKTFDGEFALSEALTAIPTPGHTPGHCSIMAASQGQHLLMIGDAAHHPIQLEHHNWIPEIDLDPAETRRSREKLAALAVEREALVTGPHFPILTLGRLRRIEGGYRWEA